MRGMRRGGMRGETAFTTSVIYIQLCCMNIPVVLFIGTVPG
jgi:hypothetical protein